MRIGSEYQTAFEKQQGPPSAEKVMHICGSRSCLCETPSFSSFKGLYTEKRGGGIYFSLFFFLFSLQLQPQAQKYPTAKAGHMGKQVLHIYIELLLLYCFVGGYRYWASLDFDGHIKGAALA